MPNGDNQDFPTLSRLRLCEDGKVLEPHKAHVIIRELGRGAFSHWTNYLLFAASDNSDPRTNGRLYVLQDPVALLLDLDPSRDQLNHILNVLNEQGHPQVEIDALLTTAEPKKKAAILRCIIQVLVRSGQHTVANDYLRLAWALGDHSVETLSLLGRQPADTIDWDRITNTLLSHLNVAPNTGTPDCDWYGGYHDAVTLTLFGEYRPRTKEFMTMHARFGQSAYEAIHLHAYMSHLLETRKGNYDPSARDLYTYAMAVILQSATQDLEFTDFGCTLFETIDRLSVCESRYRKGLITRQISFRGVEPSVILAETAKLLHADCRVNIYNSARDMPPASGKRIESSYQATSYGLKSTEGLWNWISQSSFSCSQIWFSIDDTDLTVSLNGKALTLFAYSKLRRAAEQAGFSMKALGAQLLMNRDWSILEVTIAVISKDTIALAENNVIYGDLGLRSLAEHGAPELSALIANAPKTTLAPDHALAAGVADKLDLRQSLQFHMGLLKHLTTLHTESP